MPNIPENINKIIDEFVKGANEILGNHVKKIILYGSYARGDYNEGSDIDIMILTDLVDEKIEEYETKIWDFAYDLECDNNFTIHLSPSIRNIDKYNTRISFMPFYKNVQKDGVVLNG